MDKEPPLPAERKYPSNAQRQAAYRQRHRQEQPATQAQLAILARSLHVVFEEAAAAGTNPLPADLLGGQPEQTLRNLIHYLDPRPETRRP